MKPVEIYLPLGERSYPIRIGRGLLGAAGELVRAASSQSRIAIIVDEVVAALHLPLLSQSLEAAGVEPVAILVPSGEASKSFAELERVVEEVLRLEPARTDLLVAMGGGVVGDLGGLAAALVKRGMGFVSVPTTLLAMVDSSVGGKTAINSRNGKNLVGVFHQPRAVWADLDSLATLPDREMRAGMAEVVKYGLIGDPAFFAWCEANGSRVLARQGRALAHAVEMSCRAKAAVVAADETEATGIRALLNLGHTFGHALEAESGYSDALLHGEAVAIGMVLAFRFSVARGLCAQVDADRVEACLARLGLPVHLPLPDPARLVAHMAHDKKKSGNTIPFILARGIGEAFVARDVRLADVELFLGEEAEVSRRRTAA
ncbi:MAG: 3-dehydroquinate synthase [Thermaurantiacus sp.]